MLNRKTGYSKYIINVGAIFGGVVPTGGFAIYGATKAFNDSFSRALHEEYKNSGVSVQVRRKTYHRNEKTDGVFSFRIFNVKPIRFVWQSFIPGATATKMCSEKLNNHPVSPADVVSSALSQVKIRNKNSRGNSIPR